MVGPALPARLRVGVISPGRVGCALGEALVAAGHTVTAVHVHSPRSAARADDRFPAVAQGPIDTVAEAADLILLAVPDTELPGVVARLAAGTGLRPGTIVVHTAGALGTAVLRPLAGRGAIVAAVHPAMTFLGTTADTQRLASACFGITADDEIGDAVAASLVLEMGGTPVRIAESDRTLYHAALAHGANNLIALIVDAVTSLEVAIAGPDGQGAATATVDGGAAGLGAQILGPLVRASLDNVLAHGRAALTGPVARGDTATVARHVDVLSEVHEQIGQSYRLLAQRAAAQQGTYPTMVEFLEVGR